MIVREALLSDPRVLEAGASAREAAELLSHPNVRSALVVEDGRLVGCVTPEAFVRAAAAGTDLRAVTAGELADGEVASVSPDTPLEEALHLMAEQGLERLAVTEGGRLVGVLPREALVRRLAEDDADG